MLENQAIGTSVMKVRAIDPDGTSPNNLVSPDFSKINMDFPPLGFEIIVVMSIFSVGDV